MIPFLMVSAVLAPTVIAPSISNIVPNTIACLYEIDLEETLVAQAFATSSIVQISLVLYHLCTQIVNKLNTRLRVL